MSYQREGLNIQFVQILKTLFNPYIYGPKIASHLIFTFYLRGGGGLVRFVQIVKAIFLY